MSARPWLEIVERELSRGKLPRHEVARLVAELSDHLADVMESRSTAGTWPARRGARGCSFTRFTEENMSMEASVVESLGSPAEIAETAVREFRRRRNLLSRSPLAAFCTFVLLPLPALCLAWAVTLAGLALLGEALEWFDIPDPSLGHEVTGLQLFFVLVVLNGIVLAPAAAVAAMFGRLARKTALRWRWGIAACLLVAAATGLVTVQATFSELPGKSMIMFGIGTSAMHLGAVAQFLIPVTTGVLVLRRPAKPVERTPAECHGG